MTRLSAAEYRAAVSEPRPSKYRSKRAYRCAGCGAVTQKDQKCQVCGSGERLKFDSKGEAKRYDILRQRQEQGLISALRIQAPLELQVKGKTIGKYIADFSYDAGGGPVYEDFKGCDTDLSKWKRKHAEAQYNIRIEIVR